MIIKLLFFILALISKVGSNIHYFLQVYAGIGIFNSFIVILRAFFFAYGGIKAAKIVHKNLLRSVTEVK